MRGGGGGGMCAPRYKYLVVLSLRDGASNTLMEHSESVPHAALSFPSGVGIRKQPNIYQASRTIKTDCECQCWISVFGSLKMMFCIVK